MHEMKNRAGVWARLFRLPALVLAVACQIALFGTGLPDEPTDALSLQSVAVMCHTQPGAKHAPLPAHRHDGAHSPCTMAAAFGQTGMLHAPGIVVPEPLAVAVLAGGPAAIRAPPSPPFRTSYPTGPPAA
jgi:hypothetical protein